MKYIIMECHSSYAVLLDEEGRFLKAANRQYQIGQTVDDPILMKEPGTGKRIKLRAIMGIAAAAACFLLAFTGYYRDYMVRDTSICLTINPSVRMELNRKGQVLSVAGVNEDGRKLLEGYQQGSKDRLAVTRELIDRAIHMGYLSAGGKVVLDIDAPDEVVFQKYGVEFRTELTDYLKETWSVEIEIVRDDKGAQVPPVVPKEDTVPPVEIEINGIEPAEDVPETPLPDTGTEPPLQDLIPQEPPAHTPDHEEYTGSDHRESPAGEGDSAPENSPGRSGNSGHGAESDDGPDREDATNSDDGEDSGYDSGTDYGAHTDAGSSSDYEEDSGYDSRAGHGERTDAGSGSDDGEDSGYDSRAGHGERTEAGSSSDDEEDSGYDSSTDYGAHTEAGSGSDYENDSGYDSHTDD